jgi:hypothetical protein
LANQIKLVYLPQQTNITIKLKQKKTNNMSTVKTATPAKEKTATVKATTTKVATVKTPAAKTATAKPVAKVKATTKVDAKTKTAKAPVEKKERKSRKGITRSFAAEVTASVSPVMATVNAFIANPETSEDALKMIRLELRKAVRATRGTIRTRKASTK